MLVHGHTPTIMGATQSDITDTTRNATALYKEVEPNKWPILYSPNYDISFWKLETIHPFDSSKWRRVFELLKDSGMLKSIDDIVQPLEATREDLLLVHTEEYINSLNVSF